MLYVSTYDFSTLYTTLPHNKLLDVVFQPMEFVVKEATKLSLKLVVNERLLGV